MVEVKSEEKKLYMKQYYDANKQRMIQQIMNRQKLIRNSDKYIEDNRDKIIEELNNGKRKFLQIQTLKKYNINIDPKTLQYYHDTGKRRKDKTIQEYIEAFEEMKNKSEEEEELTEAIEQEPEAMPTTETHRMMATMIK